MKRVVRVLCDRVEEVRKELARVEAEEVHEE
jgi:hypothetical protein